MSPAGIAAVAGSALVTVAFWVAMVCGITVETAYYIVEKVIEVAGFLFQTWVPQTLLAAWVAFQLQEISQANSRKKDRLQATYERKVDATKTLYGLIERRIYASRRYLDVIVAEPDQIANEREQYRAAVTEWNETVKISQVSILLDFNGSIGLLLDHDYFPAFVEIDGLLRKQRELVQSGKPASLQITKSVRKLLHQLNRTSLDLARTMLRDAQHDRNIMDERVAISESNIAHISYGRLFKALLEPSE